MAFSKKLLLGLVLSAPSISQTTPPAFWIPDPNGPAQNTPWIGNVSKVEFLGNVTSINTYSSRDGGFHGSVGRFEINSYGDTSQCPEGSQKDNCWDGLNFVGSNTAALDTDDPLQVQDFNTTGDRAQQFCPKMDIPVEQDNVFFAIGLSNVIETGPDQGIVFTQVNNRTVAPDGTDSGDVLGTGIGVIDASGDFPVCTRYDQYWWNATEPLWGSNTAVDGRDGYIYVFGPLLGGSFQHQWLIYLARVKPCDATNLNSYEYWNGQEFSSTRLVNPSPEQAVLQGMPPGQIFWNDYLSCWMALTRDPTDLWGLDIQTSTSLFGPWSAMSRVYQETDLNPQPIAIYAPSAHPNFDPTGATLVVTYAAYGPISAIRLTFSK